MSRWIGSWLGAILAGVVFNPIYNELFTAALGEGAKLNGKPIHVSKIETLATSLLCTGFPAHKRMASPNIHYYWDFTLRSHGVRRDGSAALDLARADGLAQPLIKEFRKRSVLQM